MPSLTTAKTETVVTTDASEFAKNMVIMMEKKIRNLEKRKSKLEDYKAKQNKGETLTAEQLKAVVKLDEVLSQIELLQELIKHCQTSVAETEKQRKKLEKKQKFEQAENEKKRLTDVLQLQNVLRVIASDDLRQALLDSLSGTLTLEQQELDCLANFFQHINPDRNTQESLHDQMRKVAEHLQAFLDARDKAVCGTTYHNLYDLINKLKQTTYFTQTRIPQVTDDNDASTEKEFVVVQTEDVPHPESEEVRLALPPEVVPEHEVPEQPEQIYIQQTEDDYSHQHQLHRQEKKTLHQIVQPVQGHFSFIQDSEIDVDSPSHVDPAVLSVHQLPAQYQQQLLSQQTENSMYIQQPYQQYVTPAAYHQHSVPAQLPVQNENDVQSDPNDASPSDQYDDEGYPQGNSGAQESFDQHQTDEYPQHSGGMRNDSRGGYRGRRGAPHSNGYGQRGNHRGGYKEGGFRGDRTGGNGFYDGRGRGGRGGQRGDFYGYKGHRGQSSGRGSPAARGNQGGRYRGQNQPPVSQPAQQQ